MRNPKVRVIREPMLQVSGDYYEPLTGLWGTISKAFPLGGLRVTEPKWGPQGGFRGAQLLDKQGQPVWSFGREEKQLYLMVKRTLQRRSPP